MCSPKTPDTSTSNMIQMQQLQLQRQQMEQLAKKETIQTPTIADATVAKSGESARKAAGSASKVAIRTTSNGLNDEANKEKKKLLGQ